MLGLDLLLALVLLDLELLNLLQGEGLAWIEGLFRWLFRSRSLPRVVSWLISLWSCFLVHHEGLLLL